MEEAPEDGNIFLSASDDIITKIIVGKITPFEAYLQTEMGIKPVVVDGIAGLLETLFPKIPVDS